MASKPDPAMAFIMLVAYYTMMESMNHVPPFFPE